jgi:Predicted thiol oxidoreductase
MKWTGIGPGASRRETGAAVSSAGRAYARAVRLSSSRHVLAALSLLLFSYPAVTADAPAWPASMTERGDLNRKDRRRVEAVTRPATDFTAPENFERMPGGAATSLKLVNRDAFSHSSANLTFAEEDDFKLGNALFRKVWVQSPSSTQASDGLGPLFNERACQSCHLKDGRGRPPESGLRSTSMFLRLARTAVTEEERQALADLVALTLDDPVYGGQLQEQAIPGLKPEGRMVVSYEEVPFTYPDGSVATLRKPTYAVESLAYGPLAPGVTLSPRVANPMPGTGLIQAIHPADLIALADPDDADGDGISGRVALARGTRPEAPVIGRFGWKAQNATVREQTASAFSGDIGISTPDAPAPWGECTAAQAECRAAPDGVQSRLGDTEAPDPVLELVTFYSENLAVPARRDIDDPEVLAGKRLFYGAGCIACHTPKFVTRRDAGNPAHAFQLIWPYSDFLLHDMGEGLADGQTVGVASGTEWRTPPLWGIGLTETVSGHTFFLHDGRARNLEEAILWHGGEAAKARDAYAALDRKEREALVRFLNSL